jgi:AbiV family abortive infection protein
LQGAARATLGGVDANAVRTADRRVLVECAAAVAGNARDLLADAELLFGAGRWPRAYALAVLAAEEWAKAYGVITISFMPAGMRAQIPVREILEGHRLKMMGAALMTVVEAARPGVASRVAAMPDLAGVLSEAAEQAGDANVAKQRGLYADLMADGTLSVPSDVTESEAAGAMARAREVGASATLLHDQEALAAFADPPAEALAVAEVLFGHWYEAKDIDNADDAAALIRNLAAQLAPAEAPAS